MASQRPLTYILSGPTFLTKALFEAGYKVLSDFEGVGAEDLADELKIGIVNAEDLLRQVNAAKSSSQRIRSTPGNTQSSPHSSQRTINQSSRAFGNGFVLPQGSQTVSALLHSQGCHANGNGNSSGDGVSLGGYGQHTFKGGASWNTGCGVVDQMLRDVLAGPQGTAIIARSELDRPEEASNENEERENENENEQSRGSFTQGTVMEISSPPGGGKTSMVVSLVMSGWRPGTRTEKEGGERDRKTGEVLIVDTEGGLTPSRLKQAAMAMLKDRKDITPEAVLSDIHLVRVVDQVEFVAFWHTLNEWLTEHPKVNLIVIDTLSFHLRDPQIPAATKRRLIDLIRHTIGKASTTHRCGVIVTNQMATKLVMFDGKPATFETADKTVLKAQLGETWMTQNTIKMILWRGKIAGERHAFVESRHEQKQEPPAHFPIVPRFNGNGDETGIMLSTGSDRECIQDGLRAEEEVMSGRLRPRWPEFCVDVNGFIADIIPP